MEEPNQNPFAICLDAETFERVLRGLMPVARIHGSERPHLYGITFDAAGGIAASDGHRLHYVETAKSENARAARRVVVPYPEIRRLAVNLPFYRGRAGLMGEKVAIQFDGRSAFVTIGHEKTIWADRQTITMLQIDPVVGVDWRAVVPRTDRHPSKPAMRSKYVRDAAAFLAGMSRSADAGIRVFSGGELDPVTMVAVGSKAEGILEAVAVVMPMRV